MKLIQINTISGYIKLEQLRKKWSFKVDNNIFGKEDPLFSQIRNQIKEDKKNYTLSSIKIKMNLGKKLTYEELEFLRENYPDLSISSASM